MSGSSLAGRLSRLRRRMLTGGIGAGLGWGLLAGLFVLMVCMWFDLLVEMPSELRIACGIIALLCAVVLALRIVFIATRASLPHALARRLDVIASSRGQILSGVDLWLGGAPAATVTEGMAQIAVDRAAHFVEQIPPAAAAPANRFWRPYQILAGVLFANMLVALFAGRLFQTQWARFLDPYGDHPPFSRISFTVEPGDATVIYGSGLDIKAQVTGGGVDRVELVNRSRDGSVQDVLPMFPESDGKWRATLANVTHPGRYLVRTRGARSRQFDLSVITVPSIEQVSFRIIPPAYTNRPPYEGAVPQGGIPGLPGTRVEVRAKSNRPLSGGSMQISMTGHEDAIETKVAPVAPQASEIAGAFEIQQPGKLMLRVTDIAGQDSTDQFAVPIIVLNDERPLARVMEPMANSFATPDAVLRVVALGEDDYGITRVQLFRTLNESRARPADLSVPAPPPTRHAGAEELDLAAYQLKPGDVLKLYARTEDNDPAGAKGAESTIATVRIISQDEFQKLILARQGVEALQSKYEAASRRMEAIDSELEKLLEELKQADPESELAKELREKIQNLAGELAQHAAEVEKSAKFDLPVDLDRTLSRHLKEIANEMREMSGQAETLARRPGLSPKGALDELNEMRQRINRQRHQFQEDAMEPLEHLAKIMPLMEDQVRFVAIYEAQRSLAERLDSLRAQATATDPRIRARMRDMEAEQKLLRDELGALLDDIEIHIAQLPEDKQLEELMLSAIAFAQAVRASPAADEMDHAQLALLEFAGTDAHARAKSAADILESFLSKCEAMGEQGQAALRFNPGLANGLGNSLEQLLSASMGMGAGMGRGGGAGGFAMRSNSLANVGMYGNMPQMSLQSGSGGGKDGRGAFTDGRGLLDDSGDASLANLPQRLRASGAAQTVVPLQYRRRVGEYFQRVADELGE